jgi:hypothetical protein
MKKIAIIVAAIAVLATGCGGAKAAQGDPLFPAPASSAAQAKAPVEGCKQTTTEELYVQRLYDCGDHLVYVFADSSARDDWKMAAEHFGTTVQSEGEDWVTVASTSSAAAPTPDPEAACKAALEESLERYLASGERSSTDQPTECAGLDEATYERLVDEVKAEH